jgi:hypothetical protein
MGEPRVAPAGDNARARSFHATAFSCAPRSHKASLESMLQLDLGKRVAVIGSGELQLS